MLAVKPPQFATIDAVFMRPEGFVPPGVIDFSKQIVHSPKGAHRDASQPRKHVITRSGRYVLRLGVIGCQSYSTEYRFRVDGRRARHFLFGQGRYVSLMTKLRLRAGNTITVTHTGRARRADCAQLTLTVMALL